MIDVKPYYLASSKLRIKNDTVDDIPVSYPIADEYDNNIVKIKVEQRTESELEEDQNYNMYITMENNIDTISKPSTFTPIDVLSPSILHVHRGDYELAEIGDAIVISSKYENDDTNEFFQTYQEFKESIYIISNKTYSTGKYYITLSEAFPNYKNVKTECIQVDLYKMKDIAFIEYFHIRGNELLEFKESYKLQDVDSIEYYGEKTYQIDNRIVNYSYIKNFAQYLLSAHKGGEIIDEEFEETVSASTPIVTFKLHKNVHLSIGDVIKIDEDCYFMTDDSGLDEYSNTYTIIGKRIILNEPDEFTAILTPNVKSISKIDVITTVEPDYNPISSDDVSGYLSEDQLLKEFQIDGIYYTEVSPDGTRFIGVDVTGAWRIQCTEIVQGLSEEYLYAVSCQGKVTTGSIKRSDSDNLILLFMPTDGNVSVPDSNALCQIYTSTETETKHSFTLQNLKPIRFDEAIAVTFIKPQNTMYVNIELYEPSEFIKENPELSTVGTPVITFETSFEQAVIGDFGSLSYNYDIDSNKNYIIKLTPVLDTAKETLSQYVSFSNNISEDAESKYITLVLGGSQ